MASCSSNDPLRTISSPVCEANWPRREIKLLRMEINVRRDVETEGDQLIDRVQTMGGVLKRLDRPRSKNRGATEESPSTISPKERA